MLFVLRLHFERVQFMPCKVLDNVGNISMSEWHSTLIDSSAFY